MMERYRDSLKLYSLLPSGLAFPRKGFSRGHLPGTSAENAASPMDPSTS